MRGLLICLPWAPGSPCSAACPDPGVSVATRRRWKRDILTAWARNRCTLLVLLHTLWAPSWVLLLSTGHTPPRPRGRGKQSWQDSSVLAVLCGRGLCLGGLTRGAIRVPRGNYHALGRTECMSLASTQPDTKGRCFVLLTMTMGFNSRERRRGFCRSRKCLALKGRLSECHRGIPSRIYGLKKKIFVFSFICLFIHLADRTRACLLLPCAWLVLCVCV